MQSDHTIRTASSWEPLVLQLFPSVLPPVHGQPCTCSVSVHDASLQMGSARGIHEMPNWCPTCDKVLRTSPDPVSMKEQAPQITVSLLCVPYWPYRPTLLAPTSGLLLNIGRQLPFRYDRYIETSQRRERERHAVDGHATGAKPTVTSKWQFFEVLFEGPPS